MNEEFAQLIVEILAQHHIKTEPRTEAKSATSGRIIRLMDLLWEHVPRERWLSYDYEFIESGIISLSDLIRDYARATQGEWIPVSLRETSTQRTNGTFILLDFEFRGQPVHWEIHWSGGRALQECERAIHQFAHQFLTGDFIDAGGMLDQCEYLCYLPRTALQAIRDIMKQVQLSWPTADELIAFFQSGEKDRLHWEEQWASIIQHSDLLHVNDLGQSGAHPLHVAVQEALHRNLDERVIPVLIGDYNAQPGLVDSWGKTAFDWASGNQRLIELLHIPFTGKIPLEEEYAKQDWYLPIGVYISSA